MKNNFENPSISNEDLKNRQKSAEEVAKFILDSLKKNPEFIQLIQGESMTNSKIESRYRDRLEVLLQKAVKRAGHQIDTQVIIDEARNIILEQYKLGILEPLPRYREFCDVSDEEFRLSA